MENTENDFSKFINLDEDIDLFLKRIDKIDWCSNCGKNYEAELHYEYVLEENITIAQKNVTKTSNYAGIITIDNLFQEATHRTYSYLHNNDKINLSVENLEVNDWVRLRERIITKLNTYDVEKIDEKYYQNLEFKKPVNRFAFKLLVSAIMEIYCKRMFPEIPTFYEKIMQVYEDGHLITGWNGKFPSPYLFVAKPIDNKKGQLRIW